jgi:hypothetical protein
MTRTQTFNRTMHLSRTRNWRLARCLLTAVIVGLSVTAGASATAAPSQSRQGCVAVSGAPWQLKGHGSGTSYSIEIHGLPCSLAGKWVPKLTHQRGGIGTALKGPAGFRCLSLLSSKLSKLAAGGNCSRGQLYFSWALKPSH